MNKDDIISLPNKNLRNKSTKINVITEEVQDLVKNMISAAVDWENSRPHEVSAALAAIQIDVAKRVVIVRSSLDDKSNQEFTVLINPKIIKTSGELIEDFEGCLSVKDIYGKVPRYEKVRVKALDINGEEVRIKAEGFLARILQHEIDHTNGTVFIDHIKDNKQAFYTLDKDGELQKLDYDKEIADNNILWD